MMMGIVLVSDKRIIILSFLKIMRKIELPGACTVKAQHVVQSTMKEGMSYGWNTRTIIMSGNGL